MQKRGNDWSLRGGEPRSTRCEKGQISEGRGNVGGGTENKELKDRRRGRKFRQAKNKRVSSKR